MNKASLSKAVRFRLVNPLKFHARRLLPGSARPLVKMLLVSDDKTYTSEQQLAPFRRFAGPLQKRAGVVTNHALMDDVLKSPGRIQRYDVILAKLSFRTPPADAERIIRTLAEARGRAKLVYCDGDDDPCVQWPAVLPWVDLYVKKHVFAHPGMYQAHLLGKSNLTDYVIRHHGIDISGDPNQHAGIVPPEQAGKIFLGWNIGLDEKIVDLWHQSRQWGDEPREFDMMCRAGVRDDWTKPLRQPVIDKLGGLAGRCKVLLPTQRVDPEQYYRELRSSRMCVSPFGYGEICWRDFESVLCRSLLIKPDMSHLRTEPDIFRPYETYVPVKWDFSDLQEVCLKYLGDEPARLAMVQRAYQVLDDYLSHARFVDRVRLMLERLAA